MITYHFGKLRFIEIFLPENKNDKMRFDNYINAFDLLKKMEKPVDVIGSINGMEPILQTGKKNIGKIAVHHSISNSILIIADNFSHLTHIIEKISAIWENHPEEMFLQRNEQNLLSCKLFLKFIQESEDINANFWLNFAFKELSVFIEM